MAKIFFRQFHIWYPVRSVFRLLWSLVESFISTRDKTLGYVKHAIVLPPLTNLCNRTEIKLKNFKDLYKNILITRTAQDIYSHSDILNLIWSTWQRGSLLSDIDTTVLTNAYLPLQTSCAPICNYFEHTNNRIASIRDLYVRLNYVITICVLGHGRV